MDRDQRFGRVSPQHDGAKDRGPGDWVGFRVQDLVGRDDRTRDDSKAEKTFRLKPGSFSQAIRDVTSAAPPLTEP